MVTGNIMVSKKDNRIKSYSKKYNAFWAIYISCLSSPRSLYGIQSLWNLQGNPLYQKEKKLGMKVADKMVEEGILSKNQEKFAAIKLPVEFLSEKDRDLINKTSEDEEFNNIVHKFVNDNIGIFYDFEALFKLFNEESALIKDNIVSLFILRLLIMIFHFRVDRN